MRMRVFLTLEFLENLTEDTYAIMTSQVVT